MTIYIFLALYLLILGFITYSVGKNQTEEQFTGEDKSLSASDSTWTTFASIISGYNFVFGVTFSYLYGIWYLFIFLGAALSFIAYYYIYRNYLSKYQATHNFNSLADYFGYKYGENTQLLVNIVLLISLFIFLAIQIYVNTGLLNVLLGLDKLSATIFTAAIVAFYLYFGGFKASVKTDIFQGVLMIPIVLVIFFFPFNLTTENVHTVADFKSLPLAIGLAFLQFFVLLGQTEGFQRVYAVKDSVSLKKGLTISFILAVLLALAMAYIGINFKLSGQAVDVANLFVTGVIPALPTWLASLLAISLTAAFMGNIDSTTFAFSSSIAKMFTGDRRQMILVTKYSTVLVILASSILSLYFVSFIAPVFSLVSILCVIGASLVLSCIGKINSIDMNIFLSVGIVAFLGGTYFKIVTDDPITSMYPIIAGLVALGVYRILKI